MIESLRDYLSLMEKMGQILKIKKKVNKDDIPELIERLSQYRKVLLFEEVEHYTCRLVANLAPNQNAFKMLFQTEDPYRFFVRGIQKTVKTVKTTRGELKTSNMAERDLMDFLPILRHYEKDSAPFITSAIISATDPDTGAVGRGIHRMEYRGRNRLGIALLNPPLATIYQKHLERGTRMPVSITIGVDPGILIPMALKVPPGSDKLEAAGALKGEGIKVIPSFDSSVEVPATGEFLLEGYVDEGQVKQDGPMGEISGYYLSLHETPTVVVERLSHREYPIYHALLPTCPEADMYITFMSRAYIEESTKKLFPSITNLTFVPKTFGSSLIVNVTTTEKFKIKNLILFLLTFQMIKKVVVVDDDINPEDLRDVEWAIITRCKADEDFVILDRLQGQPIDPTAQEVYGVTKVGINATVTGKKIHERALIAAGDRQRIQNILQSMGGMEQTRSWWEYQE
ncbi:MAG: 3-octaprenyl-4-hydroxybenzoate carboxy-lyase [Syntrophorhabdus sp. PtaU1.Bin050]|nr:MAG: 3-octaprenyl-4-hydroxybenzoate carboxy-lyase [Syntrophorhabdus sp. PtaU1.Bin050]